MESWLTKEEENSIKHALLKFVLRVSDPNAPTRWSTELEILPKITELLLNYLTSF